jgi:uncharacterized protein
VRARDGAVGVGIRQGAALPDDLAGKVSFVEERLTQFAGLLVAFSGGVDSSLVLALALRTLGRDRVLAVTAAGPVASPDDARWATDVAAELGAAHLVIDFPYLNIPGFAENLPDRCYLCRRRLYEELEALRRSRGLAAVVDGAIAADADDYRPGLRAATEAGVVSPLAEAGFSKEEVRDVCRALGLSVAERPASPCLASRFPYGERISEEALGMVAEAEAHLRRCGFPGVRVRHHQGSVARIEVPAEEITRLATEPLRGQVTEALRSLGYLHVAVDMRGFRSGSLSEGLEAGLE